MKRRMYNRDLKLQVVQKLETGRPTGEVCREHQLSPTMVNRWKREYESNPQYAFAGHGNPAKEETKVAQLERKIGQLYLRNEFVEQVNTALRTRLTELKKTTRRER